MKPGLSVLPGTAIRSASSHAAGGSALAARPSSSSLHRHPPAAASTTTAATAVMSSAAAATSLSSPAMLQNLVQNLRQQVSVLEVECKFLKEKLAVAATTTTNVPPAPTVTSASLQNNNNINSHNSFIRNDALMRRADELEQEVIRLQRMYADREKEHAVELAMARNPSYQQFYANNNNNKSGFFKGPNNNNNAVAVTGIDATQMGDYDGSGSGGGPLPSSFFQDEMDKRERKYQEDTRLMREMHASEVVALQKTVERLQAELNYQYYDEHQHHGGEAGAAVPSSTSSSSGGHHPPHSRAAMAAEIASYKDDLRSKYAEVELLKQQNTDMTTRLAAEQEKRHRVDNSLAETLKKVEVLERTLSEKLENELHTLEKKLKETSSSEVSKHYELQQSKALVEKLQHDLAGAVADKILAEEKCSKKEAEQKQSQEQLVALQGQQVDLAGERDYIKLQWERLQTEHAQLAIKAQQLSIKTEADRNTILVLERQYCGALDEIEAVKRRARAKDETYKGLESSDNDLRKQVYLLKQERDHAVNRLGILDKDYQDMHRRYESVRGVLQQQQAEGQLRSALEKLGKTKEEIHSLLETHLRLTNDISNTIGSIPDALTVAGALHRQQQQQQQQSHPESVVSGNSASAATANHTPAVAAPAAPKEAANANNNESAAEVALYPPVLIPSPNDAVVSTTSSTVALTREMSTYDAGLMDQLEEARRRHREQQQQQEENKKKDAIKQEAASASASASAATSTKAPVSSVPEAAAEPALYPPVVRPMGGGDQSNNTGGGGSAAATTMLSSYFTPEGESNTTATETAPTQAAVPVMAPAHHEAIKRELDAITNRISNQEADLFRSIQARNQQRQQQQEQEQVQQRQEEQQQVAEQQNAAAAALSSTQEMEQPADQEVNSAAVVPES